MKLIICTACYDVVCLRHKRRACECGKSYGLYVDNINAEIGGYAVPLGFNNTSLVRALASRPYAGDGKRFEAFVIPKVCRSIKEEQQ